MDIRIGNNPVLISEINGTNVREILYSDVNSDLTSLWVNTDYNTVFARPVVE